MLKGTRRTGEADERVALIAAKSGETVDAQIVTARSPLGLLFGLIGSPPTRSASLLLERTRTVHTFFMRGPIDLMFLGGEGRCLRIERRVGPWRIVSGPRGTTRTLETFSRDPLVWSSVVPGDLLIIQSTRHEAG